MKPYEIVNSQIENCFCKEIFNNY